MRLWVLGAGFSRRLGGPLLIDLVSPAGLQLLRHRRPGSWIMEPRFDRVVDVFRQGSTAGYWRDAEAFLGALSSYDAADVARLMPGAIDPATVAERTDAAGADMEDALHDNMHELLSDGIKLISAQCSDFVERVEDDHEAWLPYDRWVSATSPEDVFVSFNYDLVVEHAFRRRKVPLLVPNPRLGEGHYAQHQTRVRTLLKLHGSVSFRDTILVDDRRLRFENLDRNQACIAIPGNSKFQMSVTEFDGLWETAEHALREADAVSIVGYSCPASDEMAKALLLDCLAANKKRPTVDVVLGPGRSSDAQRLQSLLRCTGVEVVDRQVWAQDYLSMIGVGKGWKPTEGTEDDARILSDD